jgi:ribosomal protein L11 methyltransferase
LLGQGVFVMTLDRGQDFERTQGITPIEGESLSLAAEHYFQQSEQIPTRVRLAVGSVVTDEGVGWRAGGALIQLIAGDEARGSTEEAWDRSRALFQTLADDELLDPTITPEVLLFRLFHEDGVRLVTHFPPGADVDAVRAAVVAAVPQAVATQEPLPAVDWSEAWKARIGAHAVGALTIAPPWLADGLDLARTIIIEPGMAFGTGEHATTRGVARLLPAVLRPGHTVADLGAGSAVLSIAAAKLGAARVFAVEVDPDAIPDAEANVQRNGEGARVHVFEGDAEALLPLLGPVDVLLANIISSVLVMLLPAMAAALAPGGRAILSGILREERDGMVATLQAAGWEVVAEDTEEPWWSVTVARH